MFRTFMIKNSNSARDVRKISDMQWKCSIILGTQLPLISPVSFFSGEASLDSLFSVFYACATGLRNRVKWTPWPAALCRHGDLRSAPWQELRLSKHDVKICTSTSTRQGSKQYEQTDAMRRLYAVESITREQRASSHQRASVSPKRSEIASRQRISISPIPVSTLPVSHK